MMGGSGVLFGPKNNSSWNYLTKLIHAQSPVFFFVPIDLFLFLVAKGTSFPASTSAKFVVPIVEEGERFIRGGEWWFQPAEEHEGASVEDA